MMKTIDKKLEIGNLKNAKKLGKIVIYLLHLIE